MVTVDTLRYHRDKGRLTGCWCHMMADTREELDAMADRLGLRRQWRQHSGRPTEHYDLRGAAKREAAIAAGAVAMSSREQLRWLADRKLRLAKEPA